MAKKNTERKSLELTIDAIEKKFGRGTIFRSTDTALEAIEWISSGSAALDSALGGGYPRGRIVEIFGVESGGKTTISLHAVAEAQKKGLTCAYIDAEHSLDLNYARKLQVNVDDLLVSQPMCGEDALELLDMLIRSGEIGLVVVDSVAALVPKTELEGEMSDASMGLQARLMSKCMRKINGVAAQSKATVIFINQIRLKIGIMFGNPETVTGGQALKFYASQRLEIRRKGIIGEGTDKTGIEVKVKVVKNKVAPPFREAEFNINFAEGIDWARDLIDAALSTGKLKKEGARFTIKEEPFGPYGFDNFLAALRKDKEIQQVLKQLLLEGDEALEESLQKPSSE